MATYYCYTKSTLLPEKYSGKEKRSINKAQHILLKLKEMDLNIAYLLTNAQFILYVALTNLSDREQRFYFSNDTGSLTRNGIHLFNIKYEKVIAYEKIFISPVPGKEQTYADLLKPKETKRFELQASVAEENNQLILLFKGISFKIPKSEKFYIAFNFLDTRSNVLEVAI